MERICLDKTASKAVDDYLEYRRIVGEDDGDRLFSPEEYEEYKRAVFPQRLHNRLYVSFGVPGGIDCKLIGPETPCFCTHRYKQHQTDFEEVPSERPIALPCRVQGCQCLAFQYVHLNGSQPVRCRCKHSAYDHSETSEHLCGKCSSCSGFQSPYSCGCGQPSFAHQTLVETKAEREARGCPVGRDVPYAAMGGLTGFSSLADGYLRLDDSGAELSRSMCLRKPQDQQQPPDIQMKAEKMAVKQKASSSRGRPSTKPASLPSTKPTTSLCSKQPTKQPTK
ncbi:protein FAM221A isoform X5 [Oncorhynchus keta]|uniref:protein FAM221A isoform X5 n=1 Tax=Oncorhynchus keta TaxID=8018 RepID=UPI0015FE5382|nr:protein FAM221A isoform X5 [Oncorhynchus keta]